MPTPTFDGANLLVTLAAPTAGVLQLDAQVDLYSDWKEWQVAAFANMGFPPLFTTFGGDALVGALSAGAYYTFNNTAGWRIKPDESDHDVNLVGNLVPLDSTLPIFVPTTGAFTVLVLGIQPITQVVASGSGVTQQDKDDIEAQIFAHNVEGTENFAQMMRLMRASSVGAIAQLPDGSYLIKSKDGLTNRVDGSLGSNNSRNIDALDPD